MVRTVPSFTLEEVNYNETGLKLLHFLAQLGVSLDYDNFLPKFHKFILPNQATTLLQSQPHYSTLALLSFWQTFLPRPARILIIPIQSSILGTISEDIERLIYWREGVSCDVSRKIAHNLPTNPKALNTYLIKELEMPPLNLIKAFKEPFEIVDWIAPYSYEYVPALEYLIMGEIEKFFINLIYASTKTDLMLYRSLYEELIFKIRATYGLPNVNYS